MIRGNLKVNLSEQKSIAIQVDCFYDKKGIWRFAKYYPVMGAKRVIYQLAWQDLYTIYTLTFDRKLTRGEKLFFRKASYPLFGHLVFEKGMRADFFSKMYSIDKIVHITDKELSTGMKFKGWHNLLNDLVY